MAGEIADIPPEMRKVYGRLQQWRSTHTGHLPIPESLWTAAAELARDEGSASGVWQAQAAGESGGVAKGRVVKAKTPAAVPRRAGPAAPPTFVELMAPRPGSAPECRVELEGCRGRMRIEFKGITTAELVALSRMLWDGEP